MGTNYYWRENPQAEPIHIGKSSAGWAFSMHIIPGVIDTADDWLERWMRPGSIVTNEYGGELDGYDMWLIAVLRGASATIGRLRRHEVDGKYCIRADPKEPWDYLVGEFS